MNASTLGLLDAIAGKPARKEREGALRDTVNVDGVIFECTYDIKGSYCPACREGPMAGPAEFPFVELVSATVINTGAVLRGENLRRWDERVGLTDELQSRFETSLEEGL